jgi:hypothetical protein
MTAMRRLPDWNARVTVFLTQHARTPFRPGRHDCALFAAGCVEAMTGEDPAAAFRGRYSTLAGGRRVLRRAGFADHVALVASLFDEIAPLMAQVGDIAVVNSPEGPALGLVAGADIVVPAPQGLGAVSLMAARRAFRVPAEGC